MSTEVKLPDLGDGIEAGDILEILVRAGDVIQKDQGIVEIETDKATLEVPSTHAGKVIAIHVNEGQSVPIGAPLISIEATEGVAPEPEAAPAPQPAPAAEPTETRAREAVEPTSSEPTSSEPTNADPPAPVTTPASVAQTAAPPPSASPPASSTPVSTEMLGRHLAPAGPAVRRFAREVGVDLARVDGSGPSGRITRDDVLAVVRQTSQAGSATSPDSSPSVAEASQPATPPSGSTSAIQDEQASDPWGPVRIEKMSKIRKTIAAKMHESWSSVPRVTNFDDADVTALEKMRQASKADYAESGIKLTSMPFIIKAAALALKSNSLLNASIDMARGQI
ncbi:MAG: 2-oxo acid dehydrogenase subunit E2, partial [Planctomycetota bacterium]|nr:2-oxo acid dehydrogenase subunit E2 [Planctomycetota bacterium]